MKLTLPTMLMVLFGLITQVPAQDEKVNQMPKDYYLDASKPGVYLSREPDDDFSQVNIRLSNNSRWAIMIKIDRLLNPSDVHELMLQDGRMISGFADSIQILPNYFIDRPALETRLIHHYQCTARDGWIASGQSVWFRVSREELSTFANVYLQFYYEWEGTGNEPEHRLNFRWLDPSLKR
jgi:hypothetical protein